MVMPDKSRYVYLYLPTVEDKQRWQSLADEAGIPLSKFIIQVVESISLKNQISNQEENLSRKLDKLRSENKELRDDLKQKKIVLEKYENELKRYRSEAFLEDKFEGVRKYNKEIMAILKRSGVVDSYKLLEELGIDPEETDLVRAVSKQLEDLESYGLDYINPAWMEVGRMIEADSTSKILSSIQFNCPIQRGLPDKRH